MQNLKPGVKTSEFWMTMINAVLMALVAVGTFSKSEAQNIAAIVAPLVVAVIPVVIYILGRVQLKARADQPISPKMRRPKYNFTRGAAAKGTEVDQVGPHKHPNAAEGEG